MPIPIVVLIVAGIIVAVTGTTITVVKWDKILIALKGKRLAVLGARAVGKTHLVRFLTSGSIPSEYKQTVAPEKASSRRFSLKELDLRIKDTLDISEAVQPRSWPSRTGARRREACEPSAASPIPATCRMNSGN